MNRLRARVKGHITRPSSRLDHVIASAVLVRRLSRLIDRPVELSGGYEFSAGMTVWDAHSQTVIERLREFWRVSMRGMTTRDREGQDLALWRSIVDRQAPLLDVMKRGTDLEIHEFLTSSPQHSICDGILQGASESAMLHLNPYYRRLKARLTTLRFARLLEGLHAAHTVQNPEQGPWRVGPEQFSGSGLSELATRLGGAVSPARVFEGLFQVHVGGETFNQVDVMALNAALRLARQSDLCEARAVLEIGAGAGLSVYYARKLGLGPIFAVDLPHVAVVQAFFLMHALPADSIRLYGEPDSLGVADVTIYPHWAVKELPLPGHGVAMNQDSFAEMPAVTVTEYVQWLGSIGDWCLLSTNHESRATFGNDGREQLDVYEVIASTGDFTCVSRSPNWVRSGYVDTVWEKSRPEAM